jgi:Cu/Ag efflux protein CusF
MHKHILGAAAAALLFASTGAWAGNDHKATIQSINADASQLTLSDGKTYMVQDGVDLASLKTGDSVTIHTEMQNGQTVATRITKG